MDSNPIICGDGPAGDQVPFVRVYLDRDTGRAVIALDRAAVDILKDYLDELGPRFELATDPGAHGLRDDEAARVRDVIGRISDPLSRLYR